MGRFSMLPEIDRLPRSQREPPSAHGYDLAGLRHRRAQVRRHVVGSLGVVLVGARVLGRDPRHPLVEIAEHGGVGVLLDDERRARVLHEDRAEAGDDARRGDDLLHLA